jgi:hypothetical protein
MFSVLLSNKETALIEGRQGEKEKARESMDNGPCAKKVPSMAHCPCKIASVIVIARVLKNVIFERVGFIPWIEQSKSRSFPWLILQAHPTGHHIFDHCNIFHIIS